MYYPTADRHKYLGVIIQENLKFTMDIERRNSKENNLKKQNWILRLNQYNSVTKWHLWLSIYKSKVWYQTINLS